MLMMMLMNNQFLTFNMRMFELCTYIAFHIPYERRQFFKVSNYIAYFHTKLIHIKQWAMSDDRFQARISWHVEIFSSASLLN